MKIIPSYIIRFSGILVFALMTLYSEAQDPICCAPITTAQSVVACPSSTVTVLVTVTNFNNVGAITLRIDYLSAVMSLNSSLSSKNPLISGFLSDVPVQGVPSLRKVVFGGLQDPGVTLADGSTLLTLVFNYVAGTTPLTFINIPDTNDQCEYAYYCCPPATYLDSPTSTYYINGQVSSGVNGGTVTGGSTVISGESFGTLTLSGHTGNVIKWQRQYNGGGYEDINSTSTTLTGTAGCTGTWDYRAVVQYGSCPSANSTPTTVISITGPGGKTWNGSSNNDWSYLQNWTPCGVPSSSDNVKIPAGTPEAVINANGFSCNDLYIEKEASLKIIPGVTLTTSGIVTLQGP